MKVIPLLALAFFFGCSVLKTSNKSKVEVTPAKEWNDFFTRSDTGWVGGDIAYSISLPDGKILWCFGDALSGPADKQRKLTPQGRLILGNVMILQDGTDAKTLTGYHGGNKTAYIRPEKEGEYYWFKDGIFHKNKIYIFLYHCKPGADALNPVFFGTHLAILDYPSLKILNIIDLKKGNEIVFGSSILRQGDELFIYGARNHSYDKRMYVARVNIDSVMFPGTWKHLKESNKWEQGHENSKVIFYHNAMEFTVFKKGNYYYLLNQEPRRLSQNINRYRAVKPEGPWKDSLLLYKSPRMGKGSWTYDAKAHYQIKDPENNNRLLIHYDINALPLEQILNNVDLYRPYFIWVSGWE